MDKHTLDHDDEWIGPALSDVPVKKKRVVLMNAHLYTDQLPCAELYEKSYMHRDTLFDVTVVTRWDFLITTSVDGILKFWKKTDGGIEFIKTFRAHMGVIVGTALSSDGLHYATIATDKAIKVFDVINFGRADCLLSSG
jgi:peptidylprolyl isomerase domain and WD repeat-containing protein 1